MKQLDRLLFEQGSECFFCRKPLLKAEATIEHLVATANGGPNHEDNCVVCCKTFNALLGSKALKQKIHVLLNQKGAFRCPAESFPAQEVAVPKMKVAAPVAKPKSTISAPPKAAPAKPIFTLAPAKPPAKPNSQSRVVTCPTCKRLVPAAIGQIDYKCQGCGGAFRY
jgi:HNH endonuclease